MWPSTFKGSLAFSLAARGKASQIEATLPCCTCPPGHAWLQSDAGSLQADRGSSQRTAAQQTLMEAQLAVADAKPWFWWLNSERRAVVRERKAHQAAAAKDLANLERQRAALVSDAKSELGLWSEVLHKLNQQQRAVKSLHLPSTIHCADIAGQWPFCGFHNILDDEHGAHIEQ